MRAIQPTKAKTPAQDINDRVRLINNTICTFTKNLGISNKTLRQSIAYTSTLEISILLFLSEPSVAITEETLVAIVGNHASLFLKTRKGKVLYNRVKERLFLLVEHLTKRKN
jgi:hypothetical protein